MELVKITRSLRILVSILIVLAPTSVWLVSGPTGPFEGRPQVDYPAMESILEPDMTGRSQMADAIMERSLMRRMALSARNALDFYVFGQVETETIVTGAPGWLFYKQQFIAWNCESMDLNRRGLEGLRFQAEWASAGDVPILFAIAPNKATIEPEQVVGRAARHMTACYNEIESELRRVAAEDRTGLIVDHAAELRRIRGEAAQYYQIDSHWNSESAVAGFNQLLSAPPFSIGMPQTEYETVPHTILPGMAQNILLLNITEDSLRVLPEPVEWTDDLAGRYPEGVVVYHDSFYASLIHMFRARLNQPETIDVNMAQEGRMRALLASAGAVVAERVERNILANYANPGRTAGNRDIYEWIRERNAETASQCAWEQSLDMRAENGAEWRRMAQAEDGRFHPSESNARVMLPVPSEWGEGPVCARITIEVGSREMAQLFVPGGLDPDVPYVGSRSVVWNLDPGEHELMVVLPGTVAGGVLRLHPVASSRDFAISDLVLAPRFAPVMDQ